jgi:hypothetical protein
MALAAVAIDLVAAVMAVIAEDIDLAEVEALVAAVPIFVVAAVILVAADVTFVAAAAGVTPRAAVERVVVAAVLRTAGLRAAVVLAAVRVAGFAVAVFLAPAGRALAADARTLTTRVVAPVFAAETVFLAVFACLAAGSLPAAVVRLVVLRRVVARFFIFVGTDPSPRSDQLRGEVFHR